MQTLYIDRKDSELEIENNRLQVRLTTADKPFSIPLKVLEFLVISAPVNFSSTMLGQLAVAGVSVVVINPRKAEAICIAHGLLHNAADRRLLQYQAVSCAETKLSFSIALVRQKVRGQRMMLLRAMRKRPDQRLNLSKGINQLSRLEGNLSKVNDLDRLRGYEGAGAAIYFAAYQSIFAPRLDFTGRNRRPPRDPVNVALSLTYTLVHAEAIRALVATGFDPQLGVYHLPTFGRESLACDLVEIYRPLVDHWVWRLFAEETLRLDHFTVPEDPGGACILGKAGRAEYYRSYEYQARYWRKMLRRTARHWLSLLQADPKLAATLAVESTHE